MDTKEIMYMQAKSIKRIESLMKLNNQLTNVLCERVNVAIKAMESRDGQHVQIHPKVTVVTRPQQFLHPYSSNPE